MAGGAWRGEGPGGARTPLAASANWIAGQSSLAMPLGPRLPQQCFWPEQVALTLLGLPVQVRLQEEMRTRVRMGAGLERMNLDF